MREGCRDDPRRARASSSAAAMVTRGLSAERTVPIRFSLDETFDVREDTGTPVIEDHAGRSSASVENSRNSSLISSLSSNLKPSSE